MSHVYSLDNSINSFFEAQSATRRECDEMALKLVGGQIKPSPIQGAFSYTVIAGAAQSKIVQFRAQSSLLDMDALSLAHRIHPQTVVPVTFHNTIGDEESSPLTVYVMDRISGVTIIEAGMINEDTEGDRLVAESGRINTIKDFARFFAEAWKSPQPLSVSQRTAIHLQQTQDLEHLINSLPSHFTDTFVQLQQDLQLLFADEFPAVLRHDDLCELNILVDPETGSITRIIDWADASILPFGCDLYGVLNVMGWMDMDGWRWHNNHRELEKTFWNTFQEEIGGIDEGQRERIRIASVLGIFLRYGFTWDMEMRKRPIVVGDGSFKYLNAFVGGSGEGMFGVRGL